MADGQEKIRLWRYQLFLRPAVRDVLSDAHLLRRFLQTDRRFHVSNSTVMLDVFNTRFLHNFGCTQKAFSYNQVYVRCQASQIGCFFTGCISSAYNGYFLFAIEESVTCGTGGNALSCIFNFIWQTQIFGDRPGCYD